MPEPLSPQTVARLAPHAQLRFDAVRQAWMLLGPERVYSPSDTAVAILQALDGVADVQGVAERLAAQFNAPAQVILKDALLVLQTLESKGYLVRAKP